MSKGNSTLRTGWIIKNAKKQSIWKDPFLNKEDAASELRSQITMIQKVRPSYRGEEWKIEPFDYYGEGAQSDDDFKDFDGK